MQVHQQHHGYLRGHQLLSTSIKLERADQDAIDRLSDIAGPVQSGSSLPSYLTGYPLPSRTYFVFARTWYDHEAHRAGCALTHSLIVPLEEWSRMQAPSSLRHLHRPFPHGDRSTLEPLAAFPSEFEILEPAVAEALPELIEALFLEDLSPVLWIEENPEIAILRIVDSLWASYRSNFAFQSYTLKPRTINDRQFDLVAAPRIARSRFAHWPGRRVEGRGAPRHAWTSQLSDEIFHADEPDLSRVDPLGVLQLEGRGDPANLRMSLLWADLERQSLRSPSAALGMLDVLAASNLSAVRIEHLVIPLARRTLANQSWMRFPGGAAKFLSLVLEKLASLPPLSALDGDLVRAARDLLVEDVDEGARLLTDLALPSVHFDYLVDVAFIEASNLPDEPRLLSAILFKIDDRRLCQLLELQPDLALRALNDPTKPASFALRLSEIFPALTSERKRDLRHALPHALDESSGVLVRALLDGTDDEEFAAVTRELAHSKAFAAPTIFSAILGAGDTVPRRKALQEVIIESPLDLNVRAWSLATMLIPTDDELNWLMSLRDRRLSIATLKEADWSSSELLDAMDAQLASVQKVVELLLEAGLDRTAGGLIRYAPLPFEQKLDLAERSLPLMPQTAVGEISEDLIQSVFPVNTKRDAGLAKRALALDGATLVLKRYTSERLATLAFPDWSPSAANVRWTFEVMLANSEAMAAAFAPAADKIVARLASGRGEGFDEKLFERWAVFLEHAAPLPDSAAAVAAVESLQFALRHDRLPASELVKCAFSIVYSLVKDDHRPVYRGFFSAPLDQPTRLCHALADSYYHSNWPPRDLAIIAQRLDISDKIYEYIRDKWNGPKYLRAILKDLNPKRSDEEKQARKELRAYT